jgi:hypothetical protein
MRGERIRHLKIKFRQELAINGVSKQDKQGNQPNRPIRSAAVLHLFQQEIGENQQERRLTVGAAEHQPVKEIGTNLRCLAAAGTNLVPKAMRSLHGAKAMIGPRAPNRSRHHRRCLNLNKLQVHRPQHWAKADNKPGRSKQNKWKPAHGEHSHQVAKL